MLKPSMMSTNSAPQSALDDLEISLNNIFLQIGATFASPANFEPGNLSRTRAQLRQSLPKQQYSFESALDRLEYELNHARSVLRRDMDVMSTRRAKEEMAGSNGVVQNGHINEPKELEKISVPSKIHVEPLDDAMNLDQPQPLPDSDSTQDAAISDEKNEANDQEPIQGDAEPNGATINDNDDDLFGAGSTPLPIPPPPTDLDMGNADGGAAVSAGIEPDQAQEGPAINGTTEDFDDLFEESAGVGDEVSALNAQEQQDTDVNSLLPGLEFYANENNATPNGLDAMGEANGTGLASLDLPDPMGADDGTFTLNGVGDGTTGMMEDSTFDDWLSGLGGGTNAQVGEGLTNGEDAQFDANFFNLD